MASRELVLERWVRLGCTAALVLAFMLPCPAGANGGNAKDSSAVVKVQASAGQSDANGRQVIVVTFQIDNGWHIYANPVENEDCQPSQTTVGVKANGRPIQAAVAYPAGRLVKDKDLGAYKVYEGQVVISATVQRAAGDAGPLEVTAMYQACSQGTCLIPANVTLTVP